MRSSNIFFRGETDTDGYECSTGVRRVIKTLYDNLQTPLRDTFLLQRGKITEAYYALCPAGNACWSMRIYDAIEHETIPVILADPIIEPFERFLHWPAFTLKWMTHGTTTYVASTGQSDSIGSSESASSGSNGSSNTSTSGSGCCGNASTNSSRINESNMATVTTDSKNVTDFGNGMIKHLTDESALARAAAKAGRSIADAVTDGITVVRKLQAVRQVAPWLSFECPQNAVRCAYRLVTAEMWCRTHKGRLHPSCLRPVSTIAYQQYT